MIPSSPPDAGRRSRAAAEAEPDTLTADDRRLAAWTMVVEIRDGSRIRVRPIVTADQGEIARGFERLSSESRVRRFFNPPAHLTESMLRYLTDVDHTNHVALGAFAIDDPGEPGVAIARYVRLGDDPACAEAAVTVLDDYQGRGIAAVLLKALARIALQNGIVRFCAYVQWENADVLELARGLGASMRHDSPGLARIDVPLAAGPEPLVESPLNVALRLLARREVALVPDKEIALAPEWSRR